MDLLIDPIILVYINEHCVKSILKMSFYSFLMAFNEFANELARANVTRNDEERANAISKFMNWTQKWATLVKSTTSVAADICKSPELRDRFVSLITSLKDAEETVESSIKSLFEEVSELSNSDVMTLYLHNLHEDAITARNLAATELDKADASVAQTELDLKKHLQKVADDNERVKAERRALIQKRRQELEAELAIVVTQEAGI